MPTHTSVNRAFFVLTVALAAGLSGYLLYPALLQGRSLVHGDNLIHGYAFLQFHRDVIYQGLSPLWTDLIYAGHALFAEGQAGLSNPVNYLVAWLFPAEFGHNLIHWLAMTAFSTGCYGLGRSLSLSPPGALFAALAAGFSSLAIHVNTNMTAIEAMVWVPWTMWAFESWLRQPTPRRAIIFGLSTSMLVFSGYPHFLHGTVIYLLASLCTLLAGGPLRETLPRAVRTYWRTGLLAVAVCTAISCIQWLPLLELANLSHRREGADTGFTVATEFVIRGLLYSTDNFTQTAPLNAAYFPNTGSLAVCILASIGIVLAASARIRGHVVATLLLLNLGFGHMSPLYRFVTEYGLIPGIDSFRIMFPYFIMSIIGMGILAGNALDGLGGSVKQRLLATSPVALVLWGALTAMWCAILYRFHTDAAPLTNYVILGLGGGGMILLAMAGKRSMIPLFACLLLAAEIMLLKLAPFGTVDSSVLTRAPASVNYIRSQADAAYFKHYQVGLVVLTFTSPNSDKLADLASHELNHLIASTNVLWGISSFSGALALKSFRKPMTNDAVVEEIKGGSDARPGARLMDILSIKWIAKSLPGSATSKLLVPVRDAAGNLILWENPYAKPMIQTYRRAQFVTDAKQALSALQTDASQSLFVEADPAELAKITGTDHDTEAKITLKTLKKSATRYRFVSNSAAGYWLFLADSYYPGWKATIDDRPVKVYPAQVLGKAIYVPPGEHGIKIYFRSDSFRLGALVSLLAVACLLLYPLIFAVRRYTRRHRESESPPA